MCKERRRFSQLIGFRMANYFCCLSQNAMVCLAHCRQELQQKSPVCCNVNTGLTADTSIHLGDRAFPVAASRAWNSLPASVRDIQSLPAFCQKLMLTLFSDSFAS